MMTKFPHPCRLALTVLALPLAPFVVGAGFLYGLWQWWRPLWRSYGTFLLITCLVAPAVFLAVLAIVLDLRIQPSSTTPEVTTLLPAALTTTGNVATTLLPAALTVVCPQTAHVEPLRGRVDTVGLGLRSLTDAQLCHLLFE